MKMEEQGDRESRDEDGEEDDANCSTSENTTSVAGSSSTDKRLCSVVWKFFSVLESGKTVQCQLCRIGNKDGSLAYHEGTTSMPEHLKGYHSSAFSEATTSHAPSKSKQTKNG